MKLTKYKLGDLVEVTRGASLSGQFYAEEGELIRLTLGNFNMNGGGFKENTSKTDLYFTGPVKDEFILNKGDIITPLTEQSLGLLGTTARVPESGKYIQSQDVALVRCKEGLLDPNFCYYLISSSIVRQQLSAGAQQTKIRHTSPDKIKDCTVWVPEFEEQKKIGRILSDIDEKIILNRQINDNLEAMAKQLYDYWFVQFDFPNEEGKPYKSSGGAMVWNEKLKREIPQGWSVLSVNDIAASVRGVSYAKEDMVDSNNGVLVLRGNNIQDNHLIYDSNVAYIPSSFVSEEQRIRPLDIIMTMSSGSKEHIGKSAMFQFASEDTFGAFLTKFTAKEHCAYLLFNLFNSQYFKAKIKSIACGTGINNLTNQTFDEIYIVMPEDKLLLEFDKRQSQIFAEIGLIEKSNVELTKQRDELLPLLMNGQATVNYHLSSTPTTAFGMINKASTGIIGTAKFDMD